MEELKLAAKHFVDSFTDRTLTTEEYAEAASCRQSVIQQLESLDLKSGDDYILFKWGTLKAWILQSERGKALLAEYHSLGSSLSAMSQRDTPRQKELICQMIDECDGGLQSDWSGEYFTKQQAKDYVMEYRD